MKYIFLYIFVFPIYIYSQINYIDNVDIKKLSNDPTWLKLLHYEKNQSSLLSDDFFISKNGKNDPQAELKATIEAYFQTPISDKSARCKFPARYFWLSKYIKLPSYHVVDPKCNQLSKWSTLKNTKSISLIFVSGYLGNPASTFGHSFLTLNQEKNTTQSNLFDSSINYGALVPNQESTLLYVYRGLTGGYEAGFSDKYYYIQDLVYSNTEFRDMWNYELNLSKTQQTLLLLHIWEIVGKKFQYFFTNKNCAYMISKLLELAINEPIIKHANYWYAPIETFHEIRKINTQREKKKQKPLIKKITYIPSQQRVIYKHYNLLSHKLKKIISDKITDHKSLRDKEISVDEKIEILDFMLEYYKYLLTKNKENNITILQKNKIVLERLKLPPKPKKVVIVKNRPSPDNDNQPMLIQLGITHNKNQQTYSTIRFTPFAIESIGQNTLEGDQLIILDTKVKIDNKFNTFFIDKFDLINIRKFKTMQMPFDIESPYSWQLNIGTKYIDTKNRYNFFISGGIGQSTQIYDNVLLFGFINSSLNSNNPTITLIPNIGTYLNFYNFKTLFWIGYKTQKSIKKLHSVYHVESSYKISKNFDLSLTYSKDNTINSSMGIKWFF